MAMEFKSNVEGFMAKLRAAVKAGEAAANVPLCPADFKTFEVKCHRFFDAAKASLESQEADDAS